MAGFLVLGFLVLGFLFSGIVLADEKPQAESTDAAQTAKPLAAIIVSDDHYHADTLFPEMVPWLEENYGIRTVIIHGHGGGDFENMERLKEADVALLFIRRIAPKTEQLAIFREYLESGRPLIAFRTSSHAFSLSFDGKKQPEPGFSEWREFDGEVLGGNYHNHGPNDAGTDVVTLPVAKDHPIFAGVETEPYHSAGSLYFTLPIDEKAVLFQTGTVNGRTEPLTWLRKNEWGGTVLYSGLGHWEDFKDPRFQKMIGNAILFLSREKK